MNSQLLHIKDICIHQLFEDQVECSPDSLAVMFEDQKLTYRELNSRANQVAHYLKFLGVKPEMIVGICLDRSIEMIIGLLGILKAGGAYLPLDPTYPKERLDFMLSDTQASLVITQGGLLNEFFEKELHTVCIDIDTNLISKMSQDNLINDLASDNLAYVMYTSGSTGKPKGVMITHANVWYYLQSLNKAMKAIPNDTYIHTASFSFSSSVRQLLIPLSHGSKIILANYEQIRNPLNLFELIQKHNVTIFDTTQSVWRYGLQALDNLACDYAKVLLQSKLRLIVFSGGLLSCQLLKRVRNHLEDHTSIINIYGQTELIGVCAYPIPSQFNREEGYVPVGYAYDHVQTYVLDSNLQPVAQGGKGELHASLTPLFRGYLNRPDLTAAQFITNPFSNDSKSQLYKTGDVARYLADGSLEILGRIDHQVKVREMRIELGEIELIIDQQRNVKENVVVAKGNLDGDTRLVAYVVPESYLGDIDQQILIKELRNSLREKLPEYMLPSFFLLLSALPLTPNGKLDRKALPDPDLLNIQLDNEFVAPRTPTEKALATIWARVLGVEQVGIHDNFFLLGGNSLSSARLISEIEKAFNFKFSLSLIFQISTVAEIGKLICEQLFESSAVGTFDEINESTCGLSLEEYRALLAYRTGMTGLRLGKRGLIINILPESEVVSFPFVWIGEVKTGKRLNLKQPIYVMPGASLSLSMNSHTDYVSAIASLLVDELLSVQPSDSYSLGGWCYNGLVAMEMAQQLHKLGKNVELLTLIDVSRRTKLYKIVHKLNLRVGTIRFHSYNLSKLSIKEKKRYILDRVSQKNIDSTESKEKAIDNDAKIEQIGRLLAKAYREYTPKIYVSKVLLVTGVKHFVHGLNDLVQFNLSWLFPYNGWGDLLQGKVYVSKIQCDHLELMEDPYCEEIGRMIQLSNRDKP